MDVSGFACIDMGGNCVGGSELKKEKTMKYLLCFIAGVCVGFIVAFYIEVLSKPVLPTPDLDDTQPVKVRGE